MPPYGYDRPLAFSSPFLSTRYREEGVAYAITIHISQGSTLKRILMDISNRNFQTGLRYVGIFRVKDLGGIITDRFSEWYPLTSHRRLIKKSDRIPFMDLGERVMDNEDIFSESWQSKVSVKSEVTEKQRRPISISLLCTYNLQPTLAITQPPFIFSQSPGAQQYQIIYHSRDRFAAP